jgi:16S rRNA (uracil1498-N3)-methyltransferase
MRLNRFYLEDFSKSEFLEVERGPIFHQIKNVLRMNKGDLVSFFNKTEAIYEIEEINKKTISFIFKEDKKSDFKIKKEIILFQSIIKRDKMDWVVQKATELGVSKIVPIIANRSEKKNINLDRLKKIAIEAVEQCGRIDIPEVVEPVKFIDIWSFVEGDVFIGDVSGEDVKKIGISKKVSLIIGPEGGFEKEEIKRAKSEGAKVVSLNNYMLRSETASLSFLAILSNL